MGLGFKLKGCIFDQEYQTVFCWVNTNLQNVRFVHVEYNIDSLISKHYEISAKFLFLQWYKKISIRLGEGPDWDFPATARVCAGKSFPNVLTKRSIQYKYDDYSIIRLIFSHSDHCAKNFWKKKVFFFWNFDCTVVTMTKN